MTTPTMEHNGEPIVNTENMDLIRRAREMLQQRLDSNGWPKTSTDLWIPYFDQHGCRASDSDGGDFCRACANALVKWLRPYLEQQEDPDASEMHVDGGWRSESDSPRFCDFCGIILDVSPLSTFIESELDAFEEFKDDELNDYEVLTVLDAVAPSTKPMLLARCAAIANRIMGRQER